MDIRAMLHFVLMSLSVVLFIIAVIVAKRRKGSWFPVHKGIAGTAFLLAVIGIILMVWFKSAVGYPHFESQHSIGGAVVLLGLVLTLLFGRLVISGKQALRTPHKIAGRITLILAILVAISGVLIVTSM